MTKAGHDSQGRGGSQKAATEMIIRAPAKQNVVRCGAGTASHVQQPKARKVSDQVSTNFSLNRMESSESLEPAGAIDYGCKDRR